MVGGLKLAFHGVRGSTPCEGAQYARYGGHSSCVSLEVAGQPPVVFDLGTGLRPYGEVHGAQRPFRGTVLLTHLHWDHVQGLPFFAPLHHAATVLDVHGPRQTEGPLARVFAELMRPPFFPIRPEGLAGEVRFHDTGDDDFPVGLAKVRSRWVRHVGPTLGFRVDWNGASVAYVPDHGPGCCPDDPDDYVPAEILELCDGVDVLIHDAQHTAEEYGPKRHWGHSTIDYALHVAREAGARRLVLFHHDPSHRDDDLDVIAVASADRAAEVGGPDVVTAHEGLEMEVVPPAHGSRR
jgi:phosphoribosyl 1,2-cyclic phosphodiesterase